MAIQLTQAFVTRYAKLSALKNLIDKWLEDKKPLILAALAGEPCPDKGPYLLESKEVKCGPNYKELFIAHMIKDGGITRTSAEMFVESQAAAQDRGTSLRIEKKINPNYRKTFTLKLPA